MKQALTITQVSEYLRSMMDNDGLLCSIAVKGEISNYKIYPSGHHYFTLKDENAALKCVMFKGNSFRLKFRPDNGMKVIALGKISVYPRDGAYQLYCSAMVLDGLGDLHAAFEQLKAKLAAQGLFDREHKQKIPEYPGVIGIVTSSAGAAIHDMLRILKKRYPLTKVRLFPVRVQGSEAPGEIVSAIAYANRYALADVLIVGRGGGSLEDLWAFNDEYVAHAIYNSKIPVISAVGHEPDVTISDYVADLRAATPSNAAELAVPDKEAIAQTLDSYFAAMASGMERQIKSARERLSIVSQSQNLCNPGSYIAKKRRDISAMQQLLVANHKNLLQLKRNRFVQLTASLDAMSPLKVLSRGYAMVLDDAGDVIRSVKTLKEEDAISVQFNDGCASAQIIRIKENSI